MTGKTSGRSRGFAREALVACGVGGQGGELGNGGDVSMESSASIAESVAAAPSSAFKPTELIVRWELTDLVTVSLVSLHA